MIVRDEHDLKSSAELFHEYKSTKSIGSRNALLHRYLHLIWYARKNIVRKNPQYEEIGDDLTQEGVFALIESFGVYDPSRGIPFENFSKKRLKGKMFDFIRKNINFLPSACNRARKDVEKARDLFYAVEGRNPTDEEIIEELRKKGFADPSSIFDNSRLSVGSLDKKLENFDWDLEDDFEYYDERKNPYSDVINRDSIEFFLRGLNKKDRNPLVLHYINGLEYDEIARVEMIGASGIFHRRLRGLNMVREKIRERKYADFAA